MNLSVYARQCLRMNITKCKTSLKKSYCEGPDYVYLSSPLPNLSILFYRSAWVYNWWCLPITRNVINETPIGCDYSRQRQSLFGRREARRSLATWLLYFVWDYRMLFSSGVSLLIFCAHQELKFDPCSDCCLVFLVILFDVVEFSFSACNSYDLNHRLITLLAESNLLFSSIRGIRA